MGMITFLTVLQVYVCGEEKFVESIFPSTLLCKSQSGGIKVKVWKNCVSREGVVAVASFVFWQSARTESESGNGKFVSASKHR